MQLSYEEPSRTASLRSQKIGGRLPPLTSHLSRPEISILYILEESGLRGLQGAGKPVNDRAAYHIFVAIPYCAILITGVVVQASTLCIGCKICQPRNVGWIGKVALHLRLCQKWSFDLIAT